MSNPSPLKHITYKVLWRNKDKTIVWKEVQGYEVECKSLHLGLHRNLLPRPGSTTPIYQWVVTDIDSGSYIVEGATKRDALEKLNEKLIDKEWLKEFKKQRAEIKKLTKEVIKHDRELSMQRLSE